MACSKKTTWPVPTSIASESVVYVSYLNIPAPPLPTNTSKAERPISSATSRTTTNPKSITSRSLDKAKRIFAQFSHSSSNVSNNNNSPHRRPTLATSTQQARAQEAKRMSRTLNAMRHGCLTPPDSYEQIDLSEPRPVAVRNDVKRYSAAMAAANQNRASVYSSHCLVSGNARRSSRYFQ